METATRFHRGEHEVQKLAGVESEAARLEGMLAPPHLDGGFAKLLAQREFAVLTGRDAQGRLWTSPLRGPAGFLEARATALTVHARPQHGDPLHRIPAGQQVGLISVDFALRRRLRVNGTLTASGEGGLLIEADQAFGNCPAYIQRRILAPAGTGEAPAPDGEAHSDVLSPEQQAFVRRSDTFFLGTIAPDGGADSSHKGGSPGFVRIEGPELWWPDYAGNNLFTSLGNITANPEASLLFLDFDSGAALHMSGSASVQWVTPRDGGDETTGRRVRFRPDDITTTVLPIRSIVAAVPSPHNPEILAS